MNTINLFLLLIYKNVYNVRLYYILINWSRNILPQIVPKLSEGIIFDNLYITKMGEIGPRISQALIYYL